MPPTSLAAANPAVDLRLRRLAGGRPVRGRTRRMLTAGLVGAVTAAAPVAVALAVFVVAATLLCPPA